MDLSAPRWSIAAMVKMPCWLEICCSPRNTPMDMAMVLPFPPDPARGRNIHQGGDASPELKVQARHPLLDRLFLRRRFHGVTAELIAESRQHAVGEAVRLARAEPLEQRERDH